MYICVMCIRKYECMHCIILYFVATCKRPFGTLLLNKMNCQILRAPCTVVLEGSSGVCKNEGTFVWNFVRNSGRRKFRNCTSTVAGVINLGGRSV